MMFRVIFACSGLLATVYCLQFESCADLYKNDRLLHSGIYTIYNPYRHEPINVYCQFHDGFGYMYLSPKNHALPYIHLQTMFTDHSHVMVRHLRTDGTQYEARVAQMSAHKDIPLSVQYNAFNGYLSPINKNMTPYIYLGFLPTTVANLRGTRQGYSVNGHDVTFRNCDGHGNSYIAFLFNLHNYTDTGYSHDASMIHAWINQAYPLQRGSYLPNAYFSFFENHFGGCGGFGTPKEYPKVTGAALGLKYVVTCTDPPTPANGIKSGGGTAVGRVASFSCNPGYQMTSGDATRRCMNTGQYSNIQPICQTAPCLSEPCQNGGECFPVAAGYVCQCEVGFVGVNCETAAHQ